MLTCCRCSFLKTTSPTITLAMQRQHAVDSRRSCSTEAAAVLPQKEYPAHIVSMVDTISKLTLLEVASLNELLKAKLNIQDTPMMPMMGAGMAAAAPDAAAEEEEEEAAPVVEEQTEFTVKLVSFDAAKKVRLVKEIKNCIKDFNLVQAKKFVDAGPQVVREAIPKDDAEAMKKAL